MLANYWDIAYINSAKHLKLQMINFQKAKESCKKNS